MPIDKYVELLIKYKNIVAAFLCLIIALICFMLGRASIHIPPKEVVCKNEIATSNKLFEQIEKQKTGHIKEIRELTDNADKDCERRITEEIQSFTTSAPMLDCRICEAFVDQCKQRGEPICR